VAITINAKGTSQSSFQIGKNLVGAPTVRTGTVDPTIAPLVGNNGDLYIRYGDTSNQLWQYVLGTWVVFEILPQVGVTYTALSYTSSSTTDIITLPVNAIILNTEVSVTAAFNGSPTLNIGTPATNNLLMDNSDIDLTTPNTDKNDTSFVLPGGSPSDIQAYFTAGGATTGSLQIFIEYCSTTFSVPPTNASVVADLTALDALSPVVGQLAYVLDAGGGNPGFYVWTGAAWVAISSGGGFSYPLTAPDGSAANPSYSFSNNGNLGMYRVGSNTLALSANGTDMVQVSNTGVGINQTSVNASAILDIASTTKGILVPRMTSTQRTAISSPADGLLVYDTTQENFYYWNATSTAWVAFGSGAGGTPGGSSGQVQYNNSGSFGGFTVGSDGSLDTSTGAFILEKIQGTTVSGTTGTVDVVFSNNPTLSGTLTAGSIAASGTISGSNLSGTNTGDQTITLTGDVTGSGTGSFATTLATVNSNVGTFNSVTVNGKGLVTAATNVSASTTLDTIGSTQGDILYRDSGSWSVLAPGSSGQVLTTGGASANPSWTTSTVGTVTSVGTGSGLTGGPITTTGTISVSTNGITGSLFRQSAADTIVGNPTGSSANVTDITLGATLSFVGGALETNALTGDVTSSTNSFSTTISAGAVSASKLASGAAASNVGSLGGDLSGTLPNPTVATYNGGTAFGTMAAQNSSAVSITGGTITGMPTPSGGSDVATKSYVDNIVAAFNMHTPVQAATLATLTATYTAGTIGADGGFGVGATLTNSGTQVAFATDGYTASLNDRILVKNQSTQTQNGIYTVTTLGSGSSNWVLTRASDFDNHEIATDVEQGDYTLVENGTVNAATLWIETGANPIVIGTNNISFTQFNAAQPTLTFSGDVTGSGTTNISLILDTVNSNVGTFSALTVNGKGLVTAATNLALTGDITGTASGSSLSTTLATVNSNTGSFGSSTAIPNFTVNAKGLITAAGTSVVVAPAGTLTGTTLASNVVTSSLTTVGTIGTGTWQGSLIGPTYGGTGVNNGSSTITIGGNVAFSGAHTFTGTLTGTTNVTFPTSGTLSTTTGTVTSVTFTGDGTVLSSTPSSAVTTSGTVTAALASAGAYNLLANNTGSSATPTYVTLPALMNNALGSTQGDVLYQNGTTWTVLTPGTSGQVLTTGGPSANPSWTTVSGGGGALSWQSVQTSDFSAVSGDGYPVNTTSGVITATLPASPTIGTTIAFIDYAGKFTTNNFTINPNGNKINGLAQIAILSTNREGLTLVYVDSTEGWTALSSVYVSGAPFLQGYSASYLIAAGGGGGAYNDGGGGGAGGLVTGTTVLTIGTTYTVTVGAGGNGATSNSQVNNGSNSSITGLTVAVGGGGGCNTGTAGTGGSGGGGFNGTPGSGTSLQGNAGGTGLESGNYTGGGGGGAGAVGGNGNSTNAGNGGIGVQSSITGSAVYYCGGGGGGTAFGGSGGTGGSGGGGTGGSSSGTGGAGTANTGGGGGSGGGGGNGGNGGSGVVIISVPTANYTGTITGSPTVTTSGGNTIMKFTGSGSYTS
jgi:fibronectin-binding autotransporter adhesin